MGVQKHPTVHGTAMKSTANMRGQLGTRSGPLSPTSSKLTTQYLVLDHMTNHYSKITKAKSAIDNKPPKSITKSQKARDRQIRDHIDKTGSRPGSRVSTKTRSRPHTGMGYYDTDIYDEKLWGEVDPDDEEEQMIHNIMRTTLKGNETGGYDGAQSYPRTVYVPGQGGTRPQRPSSARSHRSVGSATSRQALEMPTKKGTYDGDVLQKRAHVFTEEKPFTPRTLKTDRVSRLSQYKYYNKPPPKEGKRGGGSNPVDQQPPRPPQHTEPTTASESRPQPKPRPRKPSTQQAVGPDTENSLTFESLRTRDFRKFEDKDQMVPPLEISMDADQMKWIKDQASKANYRANSDTLKSSLGRSGAIKEDGTYGSTDFGKTGEMSLTYGTLGDSKTRTYGTKSLLSSQKLSKEEEEAKYVEFMKMVTSDVVSRGVYTDRALSQVFEAHIKQRRGELDEYRMREMINQIRRDLDLPRSGTAADESEYHLHITEMDDTLDSDIKSKESKYSSPTNESNTLQFRSTGELYSTIHSEVPNGTLSDTMALKTYQMNITEQDDLEETDELIMEKSTPGTRPAPVSYSADTAQPRVIQVGSQPQQNADSVITVEAEVHTTPDSRRPASPGEISRPQPQSRVIQVAGKASERDRVNDGSQSPVSEKGPSVHSRHGNSPIASSRNSVLDEDDATDGDDEYEDDYDDEEEEDDEGNVNTEQTATYRTDDDDF